jgi:hypothetical protein
MTDLNRPGAYDATDPKAVEEREKALKLRAIQDRRVICELLGTASGRNWVWSLLERSHMLSTSFDGDALTMAFREGERNQGLMLWSQIQDASADLLLKTLMEKGQASG